MKFAAEDPPPRGVALPAAPGIRRLVADNPGPMTYHGTNTYLLDWQGGVAVVDPGPDDTAHVSHLLAQAAGPIRAILLTHGHRDHVGALAALKAATGAPVHAHRGTSVPFDVGLDDGEPVGAWRAVFTPGHAADHLCFAGPAGVVLSGDHVMGWSTTVVAGPGSDMADYFRSLGRVIALDAALLLPGHGPAVTAPAPYAWALLAHRRMRESAIVSALETAPRSVPELVAMLYPALGEALQRVAAANVVSHLEKLAGERRAVRDGEVWRLA